MKNEISVKEAFDLRDKMGAVLLSIDEELRKNFNVDSRITLYIEGSQNCRLPYGTVKLADVEGRAGFKPTSIHAKISFDADLQNASELSRIRLRPSPDKDTLSRLALRLRVEELEKEVNDLINEMKEMYEYD